VPPVKPRDRRSHGIRRIASDDHALELAREGVPLNFIQPQLGHANVDTTAITLQGIDPRREVTSRSVV